MERLKKIGFDNELYIKKQKQHILERIENANGKLYLEFGGKLFDDYHASRVLPGFDVNAKIKLLHELKDQAEIIFVISAGDIEKTKMRADLGITYDMDVLRLIDNITKLGIEVNSVVITKYTGQVAADAFSAKLDQHGIKNYFHKPIKGYPVDIDYICSEEGFGANPYIETIKPLVVVTAPGPGSGKLATCLSQVYHENTRGIPTGYAKFETFPIWNVPLKHPVNLAYEAATADLDDVNMIDPFHLEAYGETTVNYNRDVEAFPIVQSTLAKISNETFDYKSPTDMGVNMAGYAIVDDDVVKDASEQEIIRRFFATKCDYRKGKEKKSAVDKIKRIMQELNISPDDRKVVNIALAREEETGVPAAAIELEDGRVVTGKASELMSASSSCILNAIKAIMGIDDDLTLLTPIILEPILAMKTEILGSRSTILNLDAVLTALSVSGATSSLATKAMEGLEKLRNLEFHSTQMLDSSDESVLRQLGLRVTCEPIYPSKDLFF